jgi:inosine-uridine nucleoside N-ribohydrolase
VATDAVNDLINRAMETKEGKPLYVVAIAALTNVATAIQLKPEIIKKIVVVWLGGHPYSWHTAKEYNLKQDIIASQVVFNSSVPLVHIPCKNVAEHLRVSLPEISKRVGGCGEIGEYLYGIFKSHIVEFEMLSKPLWDIVNIAYMVNEKWVLTKLVPRPALTNQMTWSFDADRPFCRVANHVNRDAIFRDFFEKISKLKRPLEIRDYILTKDVKKSGVGNV